jgi:hypothetical protein
MAGSYRQEEMHDISQTTMGLKRVKEKAMLVPVLLSGTSSILSEQI